MQNRGLTKPTDSEYNLYCPFDIEKHKATYINYLEVIIRPDGVVEYAVPSHQAKLEMILAEKINTTIKGVRELCPRDMWLDYDKWLCEETGCILMWDFMCKGPKYTTPEQMETIRKLEEADLYKPYMGYCRLGG